MNYNCEFEEDYDDEDEDVGVDQHPVRYKILRYLPKKVLTNREGSRYLRKGCWKTLPQRYTSKQIDAVCGFYYQWGDVIKVVRVV